MRQRAAASLLYQSQYAEPVFRNLQNLIFLKIVGRILAFYRISFGYLAEFRLVIWRNFVWLFGGKLFGYLAIACLAFVPD